ncbi:S-layer homology domain-containing protein [Desulfofundulus thermobenzoicus]|uniref:S-layer homology domain-containing protein n=1 Tax=Desulfofundulus thermobenzoicus TaxID=29376 RepID=UPI003C12C743
MAKGIVFGYPDNTFRAEKHVTHAKAAVMVLRLLRVLESPWQSLTRLSALEPYRIYLVKVGAKSLNVLLEGLAPPPCCCDPCDRLWEHI